MEKKIEQHIKGIENFKKDDLKHAETQIRERLPSKEGMYWKNQGVFSRAGTWECLTNIVTGIGNFDEHSSEHTSDGWGDSKDKPPDGKILAPCVWIWILWEAINI